MNCIVTAGPTFEPLDDVRRLTNFSTGRLGTELANFLAARGHKVTLLIGEPATYAGERQAQSVKVFSTTADLRAKLKSFSGKKVDAIFHAAAVSDFSFGKMFNARCGGKVEAVQAVQKNLHARRQPVRRAGADAENHRGIARLVSAGENRRLEIRGGRQTRGCVAGGAKANRGLHDGFLRGERPGLRQGIRSGFRRTGRSILLAGGIILRTGEVCAQFLRLRF